MTSPNTPNTKLVLNSPARGDFVFKSTEVPAHIPFGGGQVLAVQRMVGGARVVDAMGRDDRDLVWNGIFVGADALQRARALDAFRVDGLPLVATWSEFAYSVIIEDYKPDFEQFFQIPYSITLKVVKDMTSQVTLSQPSVDDAINGDMATANVLGAKVGDSALTSLLGTLNSAVSSVSSFANAAQSTISGVLAPVAAVTKQVNALIASTGNTISNIATVGGVLPNNPIARQAASLNGQVAAMTSLPVLFQLQSVVGRMNSNLVSAGSAGQTVVTAGGDLQHLAAKAYGDATAWTGIARANNLTDPQLSGINTITIPALPDAANGVFNA